MNVAQFIIGLPQRGLLLFPRSYLRRRSKEHLPMMLLYPDVAGTFLPHSLGSQSGRGSCGQALLQPEFPWVILSCRPTPTALPPRATAPAHAVMSSPGCRARADSTPTEPGRALCQRRAPVAAAGVRGHARCCREAPELTSGDPVLLVGTRRRLCRLWGSKDGG